MNKYNYDFSCFYEKGAKFYYLLGAYITDGCVQKNQKENKTPKTLSISSKDENWLEIIRDLICKDIFLTQGNNSNCKVLKLHSKNLCQFMMDNGCFPKKSLTVKFPNIPNEYLPDFLRGVFDGDGSYVEYGSGECSEYITQDCLLLSASYDFTKSFSDLLNKLDFKHTMKTTNVGDKPNSIINGKEIIQKNPHYHIRICGKAAIRFMQWLYYPEHELHMPRKFEKVKSILVRYENDRKEKELKKQLKKELKKKKK